MEIHKILQLGSFFTTILLAVGQYAILETENQPTIIKFIVE